MTVCPFEEFPVINTIMEEPHFPFPSFSIWSCRNGEEANIHIRLAQHINFPKDTRNLAERGWVFALLHSSGISLTYFSQLTRTSCLAHALEPSLTTFFPFKLQNLGRATEYICN